MNASQPEAAKNALQRGEALATTTSLGVQVAVSAACGVVVPHSSGCWSWDDCSPDWGGCHSGWWTGSWWWWGGCTYWWPCWGPSLGFDYWFNTCGFWGAGSPYYSAPYAYYCSPAPVYYTYIVEDYADPAPDYELVALEPEPAPYESEAAVGEGGLYADASSPELEYRRGAGSNANVRATNELLALGDRAFRDGRYSDAVYAYAKAIELTPNDGVLHLILSDALFATGDYHYCAYALRKALELDPRLVDAVVDKHGFYGDPAELDRQLGLLERYLEDHFVDDDARLVLAANYLFSNRPIQAADLLESAFSLAVRESAAGQVILKRAQALRQPGLSSR